MKKLLLFALVSFIFFSCTDEDDPKPVYTISTEGTWKLTGFVTGEPTDINNDGTSSTNFMSETGCFSNSTLTFDANGTLVSTFDDIAIDHQLNANNEYEFVVNCTGGIPETGTWARANNQVTITYQGNSETLTQNGNFMSISILDLVEIPNSQNGTTTYSYIDATLIYTKQ